MRLVDVDKAEETMKQMETLKPSERMLFRMVLGRTPTYEPLNDPLTLDELREMDGDPVWLIGEGLARYDVFCGETMDRIAQFYKVDLPAWAYGRTWRAYRRKPEEGMT